ncbi:peptidoglycan-binding domain-containing protein [Streptomyces abyssomicinicus]|uniref:peptidoglycan-binding domain-containing protein n=1 Tax=Streptomyces abyssomicinicus TaxID=574929 RepID=UPI001FE41482|nr:peptidoglycan-binding domain-containing protein [Streptomyces abyssomicinicus]
MHLSIRRAIRTAGTVVAATVALLGAAATAAPGASAAAGDPYTCDTYEARFMASHSATMKVSAWIPYSFGIYSTECTLRQNDQGSGVRALQRSLKYCYQQNIAVDGSFGPATFIALKNAQSKLAGVDSDGVYGYYTGRAIKFPYFTPTGAFYTCR